jgi:hypothetical protein
MTTGEEPELSKAEKLVEHAKVHLESDETIEAAVLGAYETKIMGSETVRNGVLIATDRRVVFFAKKLAGYELESYPFGNISSFEQGKSMMGHSITFYASGNKIHVKWINSVAELADFTTKVKHAMSAKTVAAAPAPAVAAQPDVMGQIRQLGELRDAGILTVEEFESKKRELLSRL